MSCVNILDNDATLVPPTFGGLHTCVSLEIPVCNAGYKSFAISAKLTFNPDGSWVSSGAGQSASNCGANVIASPSGTIASGSWITGLFNPADYEIRIHGTEQATFTGWPADKWGGSDICTAPDASPGTPPHTPPLVNSPWGINAFDTGWVSLALAQQVQIIYSVSYNYTLSCWEFLHWEKDFTVEIRQISNTANKVSADSSICFDIEFD